MAVQQNKPSRSKRGHRRSHDKIKIPVFFIDNKNIGLYHHMSSLGLYRKKQFNDYFFLKK